MAADLEYADTFAPRAPPSFPDDGLHPSPPSYETENSGKFAPRAPPAEISAPPSGIFSGPFEPFPRFMLEFDADAPPDPRVLRALDLYRATTVHAIPPDAPIHCGDGDASPLEPGEWGGVYRCNGREVLVLCARHWDRRQPNLADIAACDTWSDVARICSASRGTRIALAATELAQKIVDGVSTDSLLYICPLVFVSASIADRRVSVSVGCVPRDVRFPSAHAYDLVIPSQSKTSVWIVPKGDRRPSAEQVDCISAIARDLPYIALDYGHSVFVDDCPVYGHEASEDLAWRLVASKSVRGRTRDLPNIQRGLDAGQVAFMAKKLADITRCPKA